MQKALSKSSDRKQIKIFLISTFILVHILFFVDEGYNDFRWMKSFGNWLVFGIYFFVIFGFQYAISRLIFSKLQLKNNTAFIVVFGVIVGLIVLFNIFA